MFMLICVTGLMLRGVRRFWRENRSAGSPYFILIAVFPLTYYITLALMDYRQPIEPAIVVLVVAGLFPWKLTNANEWIGAEAREFVCAECKIESMKTYLVTGGCGFIGVNLVTRLTGRGGRVRVLDNLSLGKREDIEPLGVDLQVGDIRDLAAVEKACKDVDVVVHLAGHTRVVESVTNPELNFEINAIGTMNVLRACRAAGVQKVIFASTGGAILGEQKPPVHEGMVPRPVSPYGASKLVGEAYCSAFYGSYGLNTVALRFSNVYGPWSYHKGDPQVQPVRSASAPPGRSWKFCAPMARAIAISARWCGSIYRSSPARAIVRKAAARDMAAARAMRRFIETGAWREAADGAIREALVNLESIPAPAGEMDVVLGAGWPGVMLHEAVGHGLEGDFNRKRTSAFAGLMGQQVAAKGVTVVDDGTMASRRGSLSIDDEGTPTSRTVLIEDGILVGYMQDRQNARLMNMKPTGNGRRQGYAHVPMPRMTNTYMLAGQRDPAEILASVKNGIYAANFGGGQVDIASGKYVFQCTEAYKIENGKVGAPLKGAMLIGNGPTDLHRITMIGNDLALDTGIGTCGKNGQGVPVGVGQPTLRMERITVGGTGA